MKSIGADQHEDKTIYPRPKAVLADLHLIERDGDIVLFCSRWIGGGGVSLLALVTNGFVALLLFRHRKGDANRSSVCLCARNDALANVTVIAAAQAVAYTGSGWPDILAAVALAGLGLMSGITVMRKARGELRERARGT